MLARGEGERLVLMGRQRGGERDREGWVELVGGGSCADLEISVKAGHHPVGHFADHDPDLGHDGRHLEEAWYHSQDRIVSALVVFLTRASSK